MSKKCKKVFKNLLSLLLAVVLVVTVLPLNGSVFQPETAEAATSSAYKDLAKTVNRLAPFETYAMPSSKASRVYGYNNTWLGWWKTSYFIGTYDEPLVVLGMTEDGRAVNVAYLNGAGKQRTKWFKAEDIFGFDSISLMSTNLTVDANVMRMRNATTLRNYGTIYADDDWVYNLGTYTVGNQQTYATLYKLSNPKWVCGVQVQHKMGLCQSNVVYQSINAKRIQQNAYTISGYASQVQLSYYQPNIKINGSHPTYTRANWVSSNVDVCTVDSNGVVTAVCDGTAIVTAQIGNQTLRATITVKDSPKIVHPMTNFRITRTFSYRAYDSTRSDHLGVDYCTVNGEDADALSFANGKVAKTGWNNANGYYVIVSHQISGKTVYSFYGHLKSFCVVENDTVVAGQVIGKVGRTGSAGNGVDHIHFAVTDTLKPGNYWGYGTSFTGNKVYYSKVTYYNPSYIIQYRKLPA